ncbi:MAG: hypothetical protein DWP97_11630 [Calditrichaeota bacterium]|nr:MAG: hypothetical protein DWP97_11630 [Calditrichota bacterium]
MTTPGSHDVATTNINVEISIIECIKEGWEMFKKHFLILMGGFIVFFAITILIQFTMIGMFVSIAIMPPLLGGWILFLLNAARDSNPRVGDLFKGFDRYGMTMGVYWLSTLIVGILLFPSFLYIFGNLLFSPEFLSGNLFYSEFFEIYFFVFCNAAIIFLIFIRFVLFWFVAMDEMERGIVNVFNESARLMKGHVVSYLQLSILGFLLTLGGFILLVIPGLIIMAVFILAQIRFYLKLKEIKNTRIE